MNTILAIIIDWLSVTIMGYTPTEVINLLGLGSLTWQTVRGSKGYRARMTACDISIAYDGAPGMGVWIEITGTGCRAFEAISSLSWEELFAWFHAHADTTHISRLDVACDDRSGVSSMQSMLRDIEKGNYRSKARQHRIILSGSNNTETIGSTIYMGSAKSDMLMRIYDKGAQKNADDINWIRVELQMRNDRARNFVDKACADSIGSVYSGATMNFLAFLTPQKNDSNKARWPIRPYWQKFLGDTARISLFSRPGNAYTEEACHDYVINQAGNAIDALARMHGWPWLQYMIDHRTVRRNSKYDDMVANYKRLHPEGNADEVTILAQINAPGMIYPKSIDVPGYDDSSIRAWEIRNRIEVDYDLADAKQIHKAITDLRKYADRKGLSYIAIHPNSAEAYYPELMDLLARDFGIKYDKDIGVYKFYRLFW
ncbi:MAG: replication initiation factor domain-containing protein [Oscillospiraceae bacterium]|nr:replication initiation factor domain-containing protein [Oscillospiraceae bacterium]